MRIKGEIVSGKQVIISKIDNKLDIFTDQEIKVKLLNKDIEIENTEFHTEGITFFIKDRDKILLDVYKII